MAGFTKLFGSITDSSIWAEPDSVRIVWITLLAMCNRDGIVEASIVGVAGRARKSIEETQEAMDRLSGPDPYSRTPDNDGRRIRKVAGGWLILNYTYYRQKRDKDEAQLKDTIRKRNSRAKKKGVPEEI